MMLIMIMHDDGDDGDDGDEGGGDGDGDGGGGDGDDDEGDHGDASGKPRRKHQNKKVRKAKHDAREAAEKERADRNFRPRVRGVRLVAGCMLALLIVQSEIVQVDSENACVILELAAKFHGPCYKWLWWFAHSTMHVS